MSMSIYIIRKKQQSYLQFLRKTFPLKLKKIISNFNGILKGHKDPHQEEKSESKIVRA